MMSEEKQKESHIAEVEQQPQVAADDTNENEHDSESDDEMILEESPCGRWQKRKEGVQQQEVPGIDQAFLAMDTEEGVEVVWNEVQFSEKKKLNAKQEQIKQVFDNLINLEHANIAKLHKYWFDNKSPNPRIIFITEYMSSGSLKNFLIKAPKRSIKTWKRWTTQILSALSYLHGCDPPIIHGNLTLDMIFLQHNGLIKISSVAPDAIHNHVRTCTMQMKNMHYIAPEYETPSQVSAAVDIYSFGICALGMITKVLPLSADSKEAPVHLENIQKAVDSIEDPLLKQFVTVCLNKDPSSRPTARKLLFHPALFEIHALKLVAAHSFVQYLSKIPNENIREELQQSMRVVPSAVIAQIKHTDGREPVNWLFSQVPAALELEKFVEDVKNGVYPILSRGESRSKMSREPTRPRAVSPDQVDNSEKSELPELNEVEQRSIISMECQFEKNAEGAITMTLTLKFDDKMNRQLTTELLDEDTAVAIADELEKYALINGQDKEKLSLLIEEEQRTYMAKSAVAAVISQSEEETVAQPPVVSA